MNAPSKKRLMESLNITSEKAELVRKLIRNEVKTRDISLFPETAKWLDQCYNEPCYRERLMSCLNEVIQGNGVESIEGDDWRWPAASYVNTGDTYSPTLLLDWEKNTISLTTWRDWVERRETCSR